MNPYIKGPIKNLLWKAGIDVRRVNQDYVSAQKNESKWLAELGIGTIIDIGANEGQFAIAERKIFPEAELYCFEPLKDSFEKLCASFKGDAKFHGFNFALGDREEEHTIYRSEFSPSSSLLPMGERHKKEFPYSAAESEEKIQVKTLDSMASQIPVKGNLMIKMDVQGFESKVIVGGKAMLAKAKIVISEVSFVELYDGQPLFDEIYEPLRELGLKFSGFTGQVTSPVDGTPLQADAIFVK